MGKALVLSLGGLIAAVVARLVGDEAKAWMPWFAKRLLQVATERLPETQRQRFSEEWASHVNDVPGDMGKIITAIGCIWAAREIACTLTHRMSVSKRILKRLRDFSFAAAASLLTAPVFLIVAVLVKLECGNKESIFDRTAATGGDGRPFTLYRFRVGTVRMDGPHIRSIEVSGLGRLLQRSGLNNLPMLMNVLRGDMTLIGPVGAGQDDFSHVARETVNLRVVRITGTDGTFVPTSVSFWGVVWRRFLSGTGFAHIKTRVKQVAHWLQSRLLELLYTRRAR